MTTSWTYDVEVKVDGVDVTAALMRHTITGNQSNAIMSGTLEFVKRKLDLIKTVAAAMPVTITRKYVITVGQDQPYPLNKIIFRGYALTPEETKGRTTVQVQDKLKLLLDAEVNKVYGTKDAPVDLGEIIYDIVASAGLNASYNVENATIQTSGKTTKGMTFAHANSFTSVKSLIDALGWQLYYNPADDKVYAEPRTFRSASKPSYGPGDFSGKPRWTRDAGQLCNHLTLLPAPEVNTSQTTYIFTTTCDCINYNLQGIAVPRQPRSIISVLWTSGGGGGRTAGATKYLAGKTEDGDPNIGKHQSDFFGWIFEPSCSFMPPYNLWMVNNTYESISERHNFFAKDSLLITYSWEGPVPRVFKDDASIAAYGKVAKTLNRPDLSTDADISTAGLQYIARFKDPLEQAQIQAIQDPFKAPWLGQLCDITDPGSGKNRTNMVVTALELRYPAKRDMVTLGELDALTADYTTSLDERIRNLETSGASKDYTQGKYTPLDYVDPGGGSGGTGEPSSGGKVTVSGGVLNGPDGSPIHLKGINDSATWCGFVADTSGSYDPDSTSACPVTGGDAVDVSKTKDIATYFYRYGKALLGAGYNFVRIGAHSAWGLDSLYTKWRKNATDFDRITKAMCQGLESAGIYFQLCMSGFAETPAGEGGDGYANRRLQTTMDTRGQHLAATGYLTDNILHKGSTSYNNFADLCVHVGDLVGDFPHFVALELSNEPDNWRHCPVYWTAQYGDDYSTGGTVETAMRAWGSGLATKIRAARTKTWNITNGWTPLAGPPWRTRATVLPITNPANLIRDLNDGMDIAGCHVYHFSPIFCDSQNSGLCDGTTCGQSKIHTAIKAACTQAGMPVCNNEWGRYCDSNQVYVSSTADTMTSLGVHWACIVPASKPALGAQAIPDGWDSLPLAPAPPPTVAAKYIVTVSGGTYYAKDAGGNTLTSGAAAHTVINAAIAALTAGRSTKEKVKLQGTFALSGAIAPENYTIIELDGTAYWSTAGNGHMVYASGKHHIEIVGGTWDGKRGSRAGVWSAGNPIEFYNCSDLILDTLYVHHGTYDNVECEYCDRVTITGGEYSDCYWDSIMLAYCNDSLVDGAHVHDITQGGIYFYAENDGIAQTLNNNVVKNCKVERTKTTGISFSPRGAEDSISGGSIEGNVLIDCGTDGDHPAINVGFGGVKGQGTVVKNNIITNPAGTAGGGIEFAVDNGSCAGNSVTDAGEAGLGIRGNGSMISGNTIKTCGSQGYPNVALTGNNNTVTGNTISSKPNNSISNTGAGNTVSGNTITNP